MKLRLLALALVVCGGAAAQNPYIALQGADETSGGIVVSQPRTVLAVDVTAERDVTLSGPYARYAQKFLGVRAPLTDKMSWAVTGASVALLDPKACLDAPAPAQPSRTVMSHATSEDEFSRLQADKNDMAVLALEDAAREAANTIFSLRRHRIELITGEAGENVFGEGLKAALAEIERLEQSYLELFLGKRVVTTETPAMWSIRNPTRSSISSAVSAPPQGCSPRATFRVTWCCCRSNPQAIRLPPSRLRPRSPIP